MVALSMREARSKAGVLPLSGHAGRDSRHNPSSASKYNGKGQEAVFLPSPSSLARCYCNPIILLWDTSPLQEALHSPDNTDAPGEGDHDEQDALENALPDETGDGQGDDEPHQRAGHPPKCGLDHDGSIQSGGGLNNAGADADAKKIQAERPASSVLVPANVERIDRHWRPAEADRRVGEPRCEPRYGTAPHALGVRRTGSVQELPRHIYDQGSPKPAL